jgi:hypothetical protein
MSGWVGSGLVWLSQFISGQVRSGWVGSASVSLDRVDQVRSCQVGLSQVKLFQVRLGQVKSGQVRSSLVRSGQVSSLCFPHSSLIKRKVVLNELVVYLKKPSYTDHTFSVGVSS